VPSLFRQQWRFDRDVPVVVESDIESYFVDAGTARAEGPDLDSQTCVELECRVVEFDQTKSTRADLLVSC
jgi:hypothetical protein